MFLFHRDYEVNFVLDLWKVETLRQLPLGKSGSESYVQLELSFFQCFSSLLRGAGDIYRKGCLDTPENSRLICGTAAGQQAVVHCCDTTYCNRNITPTYPPTSIVKPGEFFQNYTSLIIYQS